MFIGLNKNFCKIFLYFKPFLNWYIIFFINILYFLIIASPIFLKEQKECNIILYIHSIITLYNLIIYILSIVIIILYFIFKLNIFLNILKINIIFGFGITFYSLFTGILWGMFSWGDLIIFDNKIYILFIMLFSYVIIYFILLNNPTINSNIIILSILLLWIPFLKLISFWWTTYHQSISINEINNIFLNLIWIYFIISLFILISIYIYILLNLIYFYINNV